MKQEIIFRDFSHIWLRFLFYQSTLAILQLESELNSNDLFFWISFQSNSCRFAVKAILDSRKSSKFCNSRFSRVVKFLQSRILFRLSSRQISTITSDSESLINRSEERRIIITNKKNEDLKNEHLMRKIIIWKRHNLKNSGLWEQFRDDFDDWDETKFVIVDLKILKKFRAFLRTHDVWVMRRRDYSIVKALFEVLQIDINTLWIEEELVDNIEKFNSDVIDHLRKTDFDRNLRDYSWHTKSRSKSWRESSSRERFTQTKLVQSIENSLKKEKQSIRQRSSLFHSQNSQKLSSIELRNVQSADRWISSEKSFLLENHDAHHHHYLICLKTFHARFPHHQSSHHRHSHRSCIRHIEKNRQHSSRLNQLEPKAIMKKSLQISLSFIQTKRNTATKTTRFSISWRFFMTCAIVLTFLNQLS